MRKLFTLLFFLAYFLISSGQVLYKCEFVDSIGVADYERMIKSIRKSLEEKNLSEEIINEYISNYFGDSKAFLQIIERNVDVYSDSAIISLNHVSQSKFHIVMQMPGNKLMVRNGQLFRYNLGLESYVPSKISDSSQTFISTGNKKDIIGYICDGYISIDSVYRIWVTEKLPNSLNPGVGLKNIKGAVLGFEVKTENGHTKSFIRKIEKPKQMI
jgi:hypothetical protein